MSRDGQAPAGERPAAAASRPGRATRPPRRSRRRRRAPGPRRVRRHMVRRATPPGRPDRARRRPPPARNPGSPAAFPRRWAIRRGREACPVQACGSPRHPGSGRAGHGCTASIARPSKKITDSNRSRMRSTRHERTLAGTGCSASTAHRE
jgi:hypothetical protein